MTTTAAAMVFKAPNRHDSIPNDNTQPGLPAYCEFAPTTTTNRTQHNSHNLPPDYEEDPNKPVPRSPSTPESSTTSETHRDSTTSSILDEKAILAAHLAHQDSAAPCYSSSTSFSLPSDDFIPTSHLQIQHAGKSWLSLPLPPRPEPIPIFAVDASTSSIKNAQPVYLSIRPSRRSGSSFLVRGSEWEEYSNTYDYENEYKQSRSRGVSLVEAGDRGGGVRQLTTTTYKFGPGNPPVVSLCLTPNQELGNLDKSTVIKSTTNDVSTVNPYEEENASSPIPSSSICTPGADDISFEIQSKGLTTRAVEFATDAFLGTSTLTRTETDVFTWRYASSSERKSMVPDGANSVLVLERRRCTTPTGGKKDKTKNKAKVTPCQQIARLIRNDEFRSPGSSASTAGNGGRLVLDLRYFENEEGKERAQQMVVTTALIMLKREVDRRRAAQIAIMAGGASGGS